MELYIKPGKYVVAVSGGIDSMVLLDILSKLPGLTLVVAHLDHGIRQDSDKDRQFVQETAKRYGFAFESTKATLGPKASEDTARKARYTFLDYTRELAKADAIITAHHQDDVLETMLINLIRGTGRSGLTSLRSRQFMLRPLVDMPKTAILAYAKQHHITWREDSTNADDRYLRNHLRHHIMPKVSAIQRQQLVTLYKRMLVVNTEIDQQRAGIIIELLSVDGLSRSQFIQLPHSVAREAMICWLRSEYGIRVDRKQIERLVTAVKTARAGTIYDVDKRTIMNISRKFAALTRR